METVQSVCVDCNASFFYTRNWGVYGHKRKRCTTCAEKREKKLTAARVRKHRSNAKPTVFRYHLRGWDGKALCGRDMTGKSMADFLNDCQHNGEAAVVCKSCANARVRRLEGGDDQ